MNFLFEFHNTYFVSNSVETVVSDLKKINDNWWNLSNNISGRVSDDGNFRLSPKWQFGYVRGLGFGSSLSYLTGNIIDENGKTKITTVARPNYVLVLFFYAFPLLLIARLFGINTFDASLIDMLLMAVIFPAVLSPVMIFGATRLRHHFEEHMNLVRVPNRNNVTTT